MMNALEKIISPHSPRIGDVYKSKSDCRFVKLTGLHENCRLFIVQEYDFDKGEFCLSYHDLSERDIDSYYEYVVDGDFDSLVETAERVFVKGDVSSVESVDEGALLMKSSDVVTEELTRVKNALRHAEIVRDVMKSKIEQQKRKLQMKVDVMNQKVDALKAQMGVVMKVVDVVETYMGVGEELRRIRTGEFASASEIVRVRQTILYMDEEMMTDWETGGVDWRDTDKFVEWVQDVKNLRIVCPDEKCVVAMKPRRFDKHYSSNYFDNKRLNEWNHHTFVVIRNGENAWLIESDKFACWETTIPTRQKMEEYAKNDEQWRTNDVGNACYRATKFLAFCQGLSERIDVFEPCENKLNFMKEEGVEIVRDYENALSTHLSWPDYVRKINENNKRGSRVIYAGGSGYFVRYYASQWSEPRKPDWGLYSLDETESHKLTFKYMPETNVWNQTEQTWDKRKRRESWVPDRNSLINFDAVKLEDLEMYLKDRTQRVHYATMLPLVMKMREEKEKEMRDENAFVELMVNEIMKVRPVLPGKLTLVVCQAVEWWKHKVIYKRALKSDDAKAWKMIWNKVMKEI